MQIVRGREGVSRVAVMADDFPGAKPGMQVKVDDFVKRGQVLFADRKAPGVLHTAPGAGKVIAIHRGARRALQSVVIELSEGERSGRDEQAECATFEHYSGRNPSELSREDIVALLVESGQWAALRARPFSKVPSPATTPRSIFVTATDTNPLAPLPEVVIEKRREDFDRGLQLVARLCEGPTYLCIREGSGVADGVTAPVRVEEFSGPLKSVFLCFKKGPIVVGGQQILPRRLILGITIEADLQQADRLSKLPGHQTRQRPVVEDFS